VNIAILGNFSDSQTAIYVLNSFRELKYRTSGTDIRKIMEDKGVEGTQTIVIKELESLDFKPDMILILKGLELKLETIKHFREMYPKVKIINWFFDKYLGTKPIWETDEYFDTLSEYDIFYCSLKGVADKLVEKGFNNVKFLDEACYPDFHGETYMNSFQRRKFNSDISFIGTIGFNLQHPLRIPILNRVIKEGFNIKIYGDFVCDPKLVKTISEVSSKERMINDRHSIVCQSSLINLGIDQDESIESGYSARLFRVLCCGGFYLTNYTKGLENYFKINLIDKPITEDQELVVYYSENDLINKLDYLLEHNELREKIAKNGQKIVMEKHKFTDRIKSMMEDLK